MPKKALIYGISGQDGYYATKLLQSKGYKIHGISHSKPALLPDIGFTQADLAWEEEAYLKPLQDFAPDEIYYLAGINSHSKISENPSLVFKVNALAPVAIMQRIASMGLKAKFFHASSAYIFEGTRGNVNENTAPIPTGTYGISKLAAHSMVSHFRKNGMFACNGILFNHESPKRPLDFVTRKITHAAAAISLGKQKEGVTLGNLDARRDWGFAGDYVEAMWMMLQQKEPDDYVVATGESHTVGDFCQEAFSHAGLQWKEHVKSDEKLVRKNEQQLQADISKIKSELGWAPKTGFKELVHMMVDSDMESIRQGG